jgi:hypothetical protein
MHLCEIEALAVGQDGSGPSPVAEGQLPGAASNSQSRPEAAARKTYSKRSFHSEPRRHALSAAAIAVRS